MPELGSCASSGRAWRLCAARHSQEEAGPLGAQPLPRVLELAASKVAEVTAFDHSGGGNVVNAAKMFARFPQGAKRPVKGCHPDDMKAFIQEAYNDLRWYDENGQVPSAAPEVQRTATTQAPTRAPSQPAAPPVMQSKSAPAPAGNGDLFGDFDAAPAPASNGWAR